MNRSTQTACVGCGKPATIAINVREDGKTTDMCRFCHHSYRTLRISQIVNLISKIFAGDVAEVANA